MDPESGGCPGLDEEGKAQTESNSTESLRQNVTGFYNFIISWPIRETLTQNRVVSIHIQVVHNLGVILNLQLIMSEPPAAFHDGETMIRMYK